MGEKVKIKAVKNTTEILKIVSVRGKASVSEVAAEADMPNSTAHDYLQSLKQTGYLINDSEGYSLSTRLLEHGTRRRLQLDIYETAKPEIAKLARETGEHASLMIEENGFGILLSTVMGEDAVEIVAHDGTKTPLHATAPGRTILANLPEERVDAIVEQHGLPKMTRNTITEREELDAELQSIKEKKYALEQGEIMDGMRGVGAPIIRRDSDKVVGAISVYGPTNRTINKQFEDMVPELLIQSANIIELNLAYS
ncbi:IclR family transcriptional regulator [Natrinema gelatinilyticum]|uniref:IclR family transcriptional regulator n=1 Tax=Natrinema gelatinilyticum TaxID=2961571 RepID=UPI0020C22F7A|nr:IclR family transcriptional regulator [Natrinema gelatinilyticum]